MDVILKIALVFALMIALLARRAPLGPVMLAASLALGLLFRMAPETLALAALRAALDFKTTIYLIIVLYLIAILENLLRTGGLLARMVAALRVIFRDHRLVASFLPAFIGFLPSAGGAMFSAPLVREATEHMGLSPGRRTFINYWFRHIWEPVFPLYPGLILAAALAGLPVAALIYRMWPCTVAAVAAGWLLSWHGVSREADRSNGDSRKAWRDAMLTMAPVLAVIVAVLAFRFDLAIMTGLAAAGLAAGLRYPIRRVPALLWEAFKPMTLLLIVGVMVFKGVLEASGAVAALPGILAAYGVPKVLVLALLPFLTGLMTGITQAYVAVSVPLLFGVMGRPDPSLGWYTLAFVSGLFGVYLSPSHLCLALTREYFGAGWGDVYKRLLPAALAVLAAAVAIYYIS
jgi:integral membrane protein (TIGR00529 family)